jgi:adenosylcobinamide kinase / adenosylcobinamide-phosphate guanylyltransferase
VGQIVLVTGGSRSGKSEYARALAEALQGPRAFVATCRATDDEMRERIEKHRQCRESSVWGTMEEPLQLAEVLRNNGQVRLFLIDCLTLWVNNIMFEASLKGRTISESHIADRVSEVLHVAAEIPATTIFVSNEVGWGIVPENAVSRLYRDLVGRCNEIVAAAADEVTLVACGLPLKLKP